MEGSRRANHCMGCRLSCQLHTWSLPAPWWIQWHASDNNMGNRRSKARAALIRFALSGRPVHWPFFEGCGVAHLGRLRTPSLGLALRGTEAKWP